MKIYPPVYFLLSTIVMAALHWFVPVGTWVQWPWSLLGLLLFLGGVLVVFRSAMLFKEHGTTIKPFEKSSAIVTTGMFRYSRNPIYLSMVVALFGVATMLGSFSPLVIPPLFAWFITRKFIVREEQMLEEEFGDNYKDYQARVRRWV